MIVCYTKEYHSSRVLMFVSVIGIIHISKIMCGNYLFSLILHVLSIRSRTEKVI